MTLVQILVFAGVALLAGSVQRSGLRGWILMVSSLLAIYWMQPSTPIRHLDFWLPTLTIVLAILVWTGTQPLTREKLQNNLSAAFVVAVLITLIGLTRYLDPVWRLIPSPPPEIIQILLMLAGVGLIMIGVWRWSSHSKLPINLLGFLLVGLFLVIKTPIFAQAASAALRSVSGQQVELASDLDIRWLGFSYVAFRLLHSLRDRLAGKLPELSLQEFLSYIILFPTVAAGPIDRVQHFLHELQGEHKLTEVRFIEGGQRIAWGLFKKFVLADGLSIFALGPTNVVQTSSGAWLWVLLYAYSFRLYLDFSGYTDIAIGLGILMGIRLPENFDRPYLKQNLTSFWNAWHMTLAQWFRAYFFNPVTRSLRSSKKQVPLPLIIFIGQIGTMLLIGLWHGVTLNFAIWGAWHGLGLFFQNRWSEAVRPRLGFLEAHPSLQKSLGAAGTLLTFHYVTLGWVWFALPKPQISWQVFARLFNA